MEVWVRCRVVAVLSSTSQMKVPLCGVVTWFARDLSSGLLADCDGQTRVVGSRRHWCTSTTLLSACS